MGSAEATVTDQCPATDPRLLRFVGKGAPANGATVFLTCCSE